MYVLTHGRNSRRVLFFYVSIRLSLHGDVKKLCILWMISQYRIFILIKSQGAFFNLILIYKG